MLLGVIASIAAVMAWLAYRGWRDYRRHRSDLTEATVSRALMADRLRIAAELHDLASHALGAITLQARAGVLTSDNVDSRQAFEEIAALSRNATEELRQVLSVLREPGAAAPHRPTPGLRDLPRLLDKVRDTGVQVTVAGDDVHCSPATGLLIYHTVLEAMRNVQRHAGPTTASVVIERDDNAVVVTVENDRGPTRVENPGSGHGLTLLHERLSAAGGDLVTGPTPLGYRVVATIPDEVDS